MLQVHSFTFNPFAEHTYVLYDETRTCAIIDPGCATQQEQQQLSDFIKAEELQVTHLINTHGHIDHVVGNQYIKHTYQVKLAIHPEEVPVLQFATTYAQSCGFPDYQAAQPDIFLTPTDVVQVGNMTLTIRHVPGHSPGHIVLYHAAAGICFVGDVLFRHNIGRTDLPGGDRDLLIKSIREQVLVLDDTTTLYPGHGQLTTVGHEKQANPYLRV